MSPDDAASISESVLTRCDKVKSGEIPEEARSRWLIRVVDLIHYVDQQPRLIIVTVDLDDTARIPRLPFALC